MARTILVPARFDLGDLRKDLDSVELGLGKLLTSALDRLAETAADRTQELWKRGPGPRPNAKNKNDRLPHIADTIAGKGYATYAAVTSDHPAAPVQEYGGTIAPRGVDIHFPAHEYAHRAAEQVMDRLEAQLDDEANALAAQYLN